MGLQAKQRCWRESQRVLLGSLTQSLSMRHSTHRPASLSHTPPSETQPCIDEQPEVQTCALGLQSLPNSQSSSLRQLTHSFWLTSQCGLLGSVLQSASVSQPLGFMHMAVMHT